MLTGFPFFQGVIGAFGAGDEDVGRRVATRIHSGDVGTGVIHGREIGIVRLDSQFPVVHGEPDFSPGQGGADGTAPGPAKLVGNGQI